MILKQRMICGKGCCFMFKEFNQLFYDSAENVWSVVPTIIQTKAILGFYKHPDYDGATCILLHGSSVILVQESVDTVKEIMNDAAAGKEGKWVATEYQQPDIEGEYLVTTNKLSYSVDFDEFKNGKWKNYGNRVLAWMPIPKPYWMVNTK